MADADLVSNSAVSKLATILASLAHGSDELRDIENASDGSGRLAAHGQCISRDTDTIKNFRIIHSLCQAKLWRGEICIALPLCLCKTVAVMEIKNAIIDSVKFDTERGLSIWVYLDYGGSGQGFGGYLLYAPKGWKAHENPKNFCGHFIWRLFEIAGVSEWDQLIGKTVRAKSDDLSVQAIGHIVKDDWFDPKLEFA